MCEAEGRASKAGRLRELLEHRGLSAAAALDASDQRKSNLADRRSYLIPTIPDEQGRVHAALNCLGSVRCTSKSGFACL